MLGGSQALSQGGIDDIERAALVSGENGEMQEEDQDARAAMIDSRPRDTSDG